MVIFMLVEKVVEKIYVGGRKMILQHKQQRCYVCRQRNGATFHINNTQTHNEIYRCRCM